MIRKSMIVIQLALLLSIVSISCVPEAGVKKTSLLGQKVKTRAQLPGELPYKVNFVRTIGGVGTGVGEFFQPMAVGVDSDNNLYVLDSGTERVQVFNNEGKYIYEFDISEQSRQQKPELVDIVVDSSYRVYVSDKQNNTVSVYEIVGKLSDESAIRAVNYSGALESKGGNKTLVELEVGAQFTFAGGSPSGFFEVKNKEPDSIEVEEVDTLESMEYQLATDGTRQVYIKVKFDHPAGLATDKIGNMFVADSYSDSVIVFDHYNDYKMSFGTFGRGINNFRNPQSIDVDYYQNIYVADTGNNRVQVFDLNCNYLMEWGGKGAGDGEFNKPAPVRLDKFSNVYVADKGNNRIQVFDANGQFLFKFSGKYTEAEEGFQPLSMVVSGEGFLYVLDSRNNILSQFEIVYREE